MTSTTGIFFSTSPRPPLVALAWAAVMMAAIVAVDPAVMSSPPTFPDNEHAKVSLEIAMNLAQCRHPAVVSGRFRPAQHLISHPGDMVVPAPDLLRSLAGTLEAYCASLNTPTTNNENSLMLVESLPWLVNRQLSVDQIGRFTSWVRVVGVGVFGFACLEAGVSLVLTGVLLLGASALLKALIVYQFTEYPFMLPTLLVWIAVCSLVFRPLQQARGWRLAAIGAAAGLVAALCANLRTSYVPMIVALWVIALAAAVRSRSMRLGDIGVRCAAIAIVAFGAGYWVLNRAVMRPLEYPAGAKTTNYTYHTIAHPLVMSLAVPANPLSEAERIQWNDSVGWEIAKRVQPDVGYLGPEYERALYRYYFGLWRARPRDMLATYWVKLLRTGRGVFLNASYFVPGRPLKKIYLVWADRTNGVELMLVSGTLTIALLWVLWRHPSPRVLIASCTAAALTLMLLESALIYSELTIFYHAFMIFVVLVGPAVVIQAALDVAREHHSAAR